MDANAPTMTPYLQTLGEMRASGVRDAGPTQPPRPNGPVLFTIKLV